MLAMVGAAAALSVLFLSNAFPISPKARLSLSLLATVAIGSFAEFRNEGKFYLKQQVHFFGPDTWIHRGLNQIVSSLGDSLYRIEYSHWNDFLTGPAIVSVLFALVFFRIYAGVRNEGPIGLSLSGPNESANLDSTLRFARILMNVGLFWFFIQAWAEKAGYLKNPYSKDEIDLPFEFAGTMLGFWMARVMTKSFDEGRERFRSTFLIDFVSSGIVGLLYTLMVGPLTESISGTIAHALYPAVPGSLEVHEYTALQQHMRPFELLLLAAATWWCLNWASQREEVARLSDNSEEPEVSSKWDVPITLAKVVGVTTGYLLILATTISIVEPQGQAWTLAAAAAGLAAGITGLWLVARTSQKTVTTVFGTGDDTPAR